MGMTPALGKIGQVMSCRSKLILTVLVMTIDALGHF